MKVVQPGPEEQREARQLLERLDLAQPDGEAGSGGTLLSALRQTLERLLAGESVAFVPLEREISPQDAAQILGISRPEVMEWIKAGVLPSSKVGSHHRIPLEAVLEKADKAKAPLPAGEGLG